MGEQVNFNLSLGFRRGRGASAPEAWRGCPSARLVLPRGGWSAPGGLLGLILARLQRLVSSLLLVPASLLHYSLPVCFWQLTAKPD